MADYVTTTGSAPFWSWQFQKRRRARMAKALSVSLSHRSATLPDDTDTTGRVRVTSASFNDAGVGSSTLSLGGADAADFEIEGGSVYLKAGTALDAGTKPRYDLLVQVDNTIKGTAKVAFTLNITGA